MFTDVGIPPYGLALISAFLFALGGARLLQPQFPICAVTRRRLASCRRSRLTVVAGSAGAYVDTQVTMIGCCHDLLAELLGFSTVAIRPRQCSVNSLFSTSPAREGCLKFAT